MELLAQRSFWFLAAALMAVSFFLYWPNRDMGFVLDDHYVIEYNAAVKDPSLWPKIWTNGLFEAAHRTPESRLNYYRPVLTASFVIDDRLWKGSPFGSRVFNLALHALNSILVFILVFALFGRRSRAALAALLFCILPVHEWVVRYLVGRGDLLQMMFSLLCMIAIIRHLRGGGRWVWWAGVVSFVLAILSREAAVLNVLFIFVLAYTITHDLKKTLWTLAPFLVIAFGYHALRVQTFPIVEGQPLAGWWPGVWAAVGLLSHLLVPAVITSVVSDGQTIATAIFLGGVGWWMYVVLRRRSWASEAPAVRFSLSWMAIGVAPLLVTHRMTERLGPVLSEHFLYSASVGFAVLLAVWLERIANPSSARILLTACLIYFLTAGFINGWYWKNERTLLTHVRDIEKSGQTVAFEQLVMRFDDDEKAVRGLIDRASNDSTRSLWVRRLGDIYHRRGDRAGAIVQLQKAVDLNPSNTEALNELAIVDLEGGQTGEGIAYLHRSLRVDPDGFDAWRILGIARYKQGDVAGAIAILRKSLSLNPDQKETALYLMMAQLLAGDAAGYVQTMERVTDRFGDERAVIRFAAHELFAHGRFAETVQVLGPTQSLFTQDPSTLALLAEAQRRSAGLPGGE